MAKSNKRRDEERRAAAAAKVAEMRRAQQAAERRRRTLIVSAIVVSAIVVVVGVFVLVQTRNSAPTVAARDVQGSTAGYGFIVGQADAPASMVVYEDFQCPSCKTFEDTDAAVLKEKVADGTLKVEYRPIAFLDRMSSTSYSTRSLNAAACVRDGSTISTWTKFHDLLFQNQPAEGTAGLSDDTLVTYAKQAGAASSLVASCITDQTFKDWAASATEAANKSGVSATPTVRLDGSDVPDATRADPAAFATMIDDAAANGTN